MYFDNGTNPERLEAIEQALQHQASYFPLCNSILWRDALEPKLYEANHAKPIMFQGLCFKKTTQRPNCLFLLRNMAPNTPLTTHLFGLLRGRTSWCSGRCRTCRPKRLLETRWCCSHKRSGAKSGHESSRKIPTIDTFLPRICLNMLKLLFVSGCFAVSPSNLTIWSNLIKVPFSIKPEWFEWFRWQLYIIYT